MALQTLALATPFARHDALEKSLRDTSDFQIIRFREQGALTVEALQAASPRYVFFLHWSWKIPRAVYENFECVIFHMTDVPFGRGGSPLQNLISRGIYRTKLTALRCVEEMDAGPVYLKRDLSLEGSAEDILRYAGTMTSEMIRTIVETNPVPVPQTGAPVLFKRRTAEEGNIVGLDDLQKVYDFIRMLDAEGYPPAFLEIGKLKLEFNRARFDHSAVEANVKITCKEAS